MKLLTTTILFVLSTYVGLYAQQQPKIVIDIPSQQKPWNTLDWNNNANKFQFAIVTDKTGGHREGIFEKGVDKLNLLQPEFVKSVGDLIEGYTKDTTRLNAEWQEFNGFIKKLQMPFFYVPGNHDITNDVMEQKWKELFGVTYYHFVYNDVLFLCLNSEDSYRGAGNGMIGDEQYNYIEKTLKENSNVRWTLVFLHQPLWVQDDTKRWKDVEKLLENRPHNVFAGHYHRYWKTERNNGKYIALATTGGASKMRGTAYGEFDHVAWVTMMDNGPLITNLLLDGIWDENIVTEDVVELVRNHPYPVTIEPLYVENSAFEQLTTPVRIKNDSDYKMHVKIDGLIHPEVFYAMSKSEITVEPNDVAILDLTIQNPKGIDISKNPIYLQTEVTYDYHDTDLVLNNMLPFAVFPKFTVSKASKKVKVDGNLKEWEKANWNTIEDFKGSPFDYSGKDDLEASFTTYYDDENLYIAVKVKDNDIFIDEKSSLWQQDAIVIGLDSRPKHISQLNDGEGRGQDWMVYFRSFKEKDAVYHPEALPEGIESAYKIDNNTITMELAVPMSYLDSKQLSAWQYVRLGVGYYDMDKDQKKTTHFWYPSWDDTKNIPGSGMIFKK
ncbi:MAG: metallophosphoesterase [Flavobacteriaceae bacterium]|nr:metallophosphoesterase [Flavobacteriaceae bacterium]